MQLMSWTLARLGSRFSLLFEPHKRRVMHSALGRYLDQPLDLMVGLVEPDGTERVLPFTTRGEPLVNAEQFERANSITYRAFSEKYNLRFEFNIHSVFYPQHEPMCIMPAFYLEMRVSPMERIRWFSAKGDIPETVKLFIRLSRPDTEITASTMDIDGQQHAQLDLNYHNSLTPGVDRTDQPKEVKCYLPDATVSERIVSLNAGCAIDDDGQGLTLDLPVTETGSGTKWRLVWGAHTADDVLLFSRDENPVTAGFRYNHYWQNLGQVIEAAVDNRDDWLGHSRRYEKLFDQAPLRMAQRHIVNHSFHAYLANTFWCDRSDGKQWFSVWEGSCFYHSTIDVEYNVSMLYFAIWPQLLKMQLDQWPDYFVKHKPSAGAFLCHDVGQGTLAAGQIYAHHMPVEENTNYLLLLQAYCHWTGDLSIAEKHADLLENLAKYLLWTDRDASGFPSEGTANTIDDASPAVQFARKQTYLAVKRVTALLAAGDLLKRCNKNELAERCEWAAREAVPKIEDHAWLGDHYAVCVDRSSTGIIDVWTDEPIAFDEDIPGWDAYSIYATNGLLLPTLIGQPVLFDVRRMKADLTNATRETLGPYGCSHSSNDPDNVWISQNLWRDHMGCYLGLYRPPISQRYWDMQVMSNTHAQSLGFIDTYINNNLAFYPRGITAMGYMLSQPRLVIDRLAPGGTQIKVDPERHRPQRWPLLPLADWKACKVPVVVIDNEGRVTIEGEADPITIVGDETEKKSPDSPDNYSV